MPLNPAGYPLDLTGLASSNYITNEVHVITTPRDRLFVPGGGPFYHIGLEIRNSVTNALLMPNIDYKLLHLHKPAAKESGKDVYAVVYIINELVPSVTMNYRVIGGIHGETASVIRTLLESFPLPNNGDSVSWGQLIGVPTQFTPAEHLHHIDEIYNFNDVVSVLEQIRIAILAGDGPAFNALYMYIHQYIQNEDYVTHDELESLTSAVPFFEIKSFPDYATMRQATTMINNAPALYAALGRDNMFDGNGRLFVWDITSTLPESEFVIKPNHIPLANPGRFIASQRIEKDIIRLATSVQRVINQDGSVEDGMLNTGNIVVGDTHNYVRQGVYWVGDSNIIANAPFSWCVLRVDNIAVASGNDSVGEVIHTFYNGNGDKCTRIRYYDVGSNSYIWSGFHFYARRNGDALQEFHVSPATVGTHAVAYSQLVDQNIRYGLTQNLAALRYTEADIYTLIDSGVWWIGNVNANRPTLSDGSQMSHFHLEVIHLNATDGILIAKNANHEARCYRYNTNQFTPWDFRANQTGDANVYFNVKDAVGPDHAVTLRQLINHETDCHLGIVIKYSGDTSVLAPCYVGESVYHGNLVKVYISNNLRVINLADIPQMFIGDGGDVLGSHGIGYVYLTRNPNTGSYRLYATPIAPETYVIGNMSKARKRLRMSTSTYWTAESYLIQPEDTCFLGMAYKQGLYPKWWLCRSWFQDPGMIEHHGLYNSARDDITSLPKISGPLARLDFDDTNTIDSNFNTPYSPFYGRPVSKIQMLCWAGEKVDFSLKSNIAINHTATATRGANIHLNLNRFRIISSGAITPLAINECLVLDGDHANAQSNSYKHHFEISDSKIVFEDGIYETLIEGGTSNVDTTGYLAGAHASGVSRTVLSMAVNEYHAFREFVVATIALPAEQLTITLSASYYNIDLDSLFTNIHGPYSSHPFLTRITLDIINGAIIGSTATNQSSLWISNAIPAGVEVVVNLGGGCYLVGKGGKGGDNSGAPPYNLNAEDGGDAIASQRNFVINVFGVLGGGGGGGASGRFGSSYATGSDGGPGGGGAGSQVGAAGSRWRTTPIGGDETAAGPASDGTLTTGGVGGETYVGGPRNGHTSQGAHGGSGGNLGQPGGAEYDGYAHDGGGGAAGAAGRAISLSNGALAKVNIVGGQVYGAY